jgi:hypothetical protein
MDMLAISHMQYTEPMIRRGVRLHFMPMAASADRYLVPSSGDSMGVLMLGSASAPRVQAVAACCEVTAEVDVFGGGWREWLFPGSGRAPGASGSSIRHPLAKRMQDVGYVIPRLMAEGVSFFQRGREQRRILDAATLESARTARIHGVADDARVPGLLRHAAVMLGVNQRRGWIGDRHGIADSRLRDFEAPLSGAFYLVQSFSDLPLFYRLGVEVETWSSLAELKTKVRYFMEHPEEARKIAAAGQERARRDHTWDARLRDLLHVLGLPHLGGESLSPLRVVANLSSSPWCGASPGCEPTGGLPAPEPEWRRGSSH